MNACQIVLFMLSIIVVVKTAERVDSPFRRDFFTLSQQPLFFVM
jgi:hypothetical protein